ncbi:MAG: Flavoprotein desaturase PigA [Candidatus Erwinia impunctatus]|nr:Flavoprotein desaturase PigA [Culicoides impunctatus]
MTMTEEQFTALLTGIEAWIAPINQGWLKDDLQGEFGRHRWELLQACGLTGLLNSQQAGGLGMNAPQVARFMAHLGEHCLDGGLTFALCTHLCSTSLPLERFGSAALCEKLLPDVMAGKRIGAHAITEAGSGSDAFAMATSAQREAGGWRLNGTKIFVSNGPIADQVVIYASTDRQRGTLGGFSAFLVDVHTAGIVVGPAAHKMGLKTSPLSDIYLTDVFVDDARLLGKEGMGFAILDFVMKWEVLCVFACQAGEMRRRLAQCLKQAKTRTQFGQPVGKNQAVALRLVNMHLQVETAQYWLTRAAEALHSGKNIAGEIAAAKLVISESNVATALDAVTLFGGSGYMAKMGIEKQLRDAVGGVIYSGTSDIQRNRLATMLGL